MTEKEKQQQEKEAQAEINKRLVAFVCSRLLHISADDLTRAETSIVAEFRRYGKLTINPVTNEVDHP